MRNVFTLLILLAVLAAAWANRDKLPKVGVVPIGVQEEPALPTLNTVAAPPPPAVANPAPAPTATPIPYAARSYWQRSTDAADLIRTYRGSLVFVTGDGAGSGFIADMGGRTFFLTNTHVAAGVRGATMKTLQGDAVKPGPASLAVGHDIFAMQITATGTPFEVMRDVENNVRVGDSVVVLGNAEGGNVINPLVGSIVGFGPNLIELDAPFQPGNSGSPIVHLNSRKVIGVATYLTIRKYDPATKEPIKPVVRRFGYRIDSVKTWQPVNWPSFQAQATEMASIETLTEDLTTFIKDTAGYGEVSPGKHTNPAIRSRIDAWQSSQATLTNPKDRAAATQSFVAFLKSAAQADVIQARDHLTYDYFQRRLADQQRERTEIAGVFNQVIQNLKSSELKGTPRPVRRPQGY